jgi:hypothetical protein
MARQTRLTWLVVLALACPISAGCDERVSSTNPAAQEQSAQAQAQVGDKMKEVAAVQRDSDDAKAKLEIAEKRAVEQFESSEQYKKLAKTLADSEAAKKSGPLNRRMAAAKTWLETKQAIDAARAKAISEHVEVKAATQSIALAEQKLAEATASLNQAQTAADAASAAAAPKGKFQVDASKQGERKEMIRKLQAEDVFYKIETRETAADLYVGPNFSTLDIDTKKAFVEMAFAYCYVGQPKLTHLNLVDSRSGKRIGNYYPELGLSLD